MTSGRIEGKPIRTREPVSEPDALLIQDPTLAMTHPGRPLPGAAPPGGFAALTWAVSLDSVPAAITDTFDGPVAEGNTAAARAAFAFVRDERQALNPRPV